MIKNKFLSNFEDRIYHTALSSSYLITTLAFIAVGTLTMQESFRLNKTTGLGVLIEPHLEITEDNLAAMEAYAESNDKPIVMVNLMQVRSNAEYDDPALNDSTGLDALARHTLGSAEVRKEAGAQLIWSGRAIQMPIGPAEKTWDMIVLVRYPSTRAYLNMKASKAYEGARVHRRAGQYASRLIMTIEASSSSN